MSINNDTVYSIAQVDLGAGPVLLSVPDSGERYRVLQFVDAWSNNFAYVGTRATGNGAGEFLLVPPGWQQGDTDAGPARDAAVIPFVHSPQTRAIYPLKLNEYLAAGLPVVATPFADMSGFEDLVRLADDPEASRPYFGRLRELAAEHGLSELSMGTSQDYRVAVEEGATCVRVGEVLFADLRG